MAGRSWIALPRTVSSSSRSMSARRRRSRDSPSRDQRARSRDAGSAGSSCRSTTDRSTASCVRRGCSCCRSAGGRSRRCVASWFEVGRSWSLSLARSSGTHRSPSSRSRSSVDRAFVGPRRSDGSSACRSPTISAACSPLRLSRTSGSTSCARQADPSRPRRSSVARDEPDRVRDERVRRARADRTYTAWSRRASAGSSVTSPGSVMTKRAPPCSPSSTIAVPPCSSANFLTRESPMPTPRPPAPAP